MSQDTQRGALNQPRGVEWGDIYIYLPIYIYTPMANSC